MNLQSIKVSSKTHGIIDLCSCAAMIIVPRLLGFSKHCTRVLDSAAGLALCNSVFTNYEFGLIKLMPFKAHLIADGVSGAGLIGCAAANDLLDSDEKMLVAGVGAFEICAALMTQTQSSQELYESVPDEVSMPAPRERMESRKSMAPTPSQTTEASPAMYTSTREMQSVGEHI